MAKIQIFGNILSYATPSASGDLVPKWYVDAMAENPGQTTMTIMTGTSIAPTQTGQVFYKEVTANTAFTLNASGLSAVNNEVCEFYLVINSSGNTVTLPSGWVWAGGSAPTIAEGTSIIHVFTTNAKSTWRAELLGAFPALSNSIVFTLQVPANADVWLAYGSPFESPITATWGDGSREVITTGDIQHTYTTAGTYRVKLKSANGKMPTLFFNTNSDYLRSVDYADVEWYGDSVSGTNLLYIGEMFDSCEHLTSVPATLFARNSNIGTFGLCFKNCSSLESIPAGLFGNNTSCLDFGSCFEGCSSLEALPAGLFAGFSSATSFSNCFRGCTAIPSIPADTFDGCSAVTSFAYCFMSCSSITAIPAGLFADCSNVTNFSACFEGTGVTSIPAGLFTSNRSVTNFAYCFESCRSLATVPTDLFDNLLNKADFFMCFANCSAWVPSTTTPYVPQIWERDNHAAYSISFTDTPFANTSAAVRQYVPDGWGGDITQYSSSTTYSKGDWTYYTFGGVPKVYTYINDTAGSNHMPGMATDYWAYGYLAPADVFVTFRREKSGYGINNNTTLTYYTTDFTNSNLTASWTQGSFNSATLSSTLWQQTDTLMMSTWALSNGNLTVTLSSPGPTQYPTSGLSGGDVLHFGGFVETEDSSYYYATSTTYSKN